ncbi:MAG TPA: lipid-binding SYLF domain-containing protein [Acidobacteriaceae bacterium]|nr:lipid-binding SYLF domain-containing protein [Acidobacteriaceae bacterium]
MIKKFIVTTCAVAVTFMGSQAFAATSHADLTERLNAASTVITEIESIPAKSIPKSIMSNATCVAVVPGYKKAAFVVGGSYGQGVVTCRTESGKWSAPAFVKMIGGSWGLQIGGQSTDLILIAVNDRGMQALLKTKFKIGGDAAAAAGPVGRNAEAATNLTLKSELLTYSRSQGLFAGIDLNGTVVSQNQEDTRTFYGHDVPFDKILKGDVATPPAARQFVRTIAQYFHKSQ